MTKPSHFERRKQMKHRMGLTLLAGLVLLGAAYALAPGRGAHAAAEPVWVNAQNYGSAGGGFYWDFTSGTVWTAEKGWHIFVRPASTMPEFWVNYLTYGSKGGGFFLDTVSGQVWTAERGWHLFSPVVAPATTPTSPTIPTNTPAPFPTSTPTRTPSPTPTRTPSPVPGAALSETSVAAVVRAVPGPAGTGMPGDVSVILGTGLLPVYISIYTPDALFAHFRDTPDAAWAAYGKAVLRAVDGAFPAIRAGSTSSYDAIYVSFSTSHRWSFLPDSHWEDCDYVGRGDWLCIYPEFQVRFRMQAGVFEYDAVAWTDNDHWQLVP